MDRSPPIQLNRQSMEKRETVVPLYALLLIIAAAAFHAGWNILVKRVEEKQIFTWWTLVAGFLFYLPLLARGWPIPSGIWPYALGSALVEALYFIALVRAYEHGDFSLVYPIARGAAPALLFVWAALFLGERPEAGGIAGLAILLAGLVIVGGGQLLSRRGVATVSLAGVGAALNISLCISVYTAIDGAAMRVMEASSYASLVLALTAVLLTPVVFARYGGRLILREGRAHYGKILAVAGLMLLTFILVLRAYAISRVSYAGALREVSVIFAALGGWLWMGEEFGAVRTAGAVLIFAGIAVIAFAG